MADSPPIDISSLPGPAQKILGPSAPAPAKMMAAKGIIPGLKPGDIVTVIAVLGSEADAKIAEAARATLAKLPPPLMNGALSADLPGFVTERLAESYGREHEVVEKLLRMPRITGQALVVLAERADERIGELIATNEQRMLEHPRVIEKLYMNKNVRMSTSDRLIELAVRNGLELEIPAFKEAAAAIKNELIPEATPEPTFDDVLFQETETIAARTDLDSDDDDTHELDDEGEEQLRDKFLPLYAQIGQMTVTQKIRRAQLGTAAERLLLVRDPNRLVAVAAVKSPMMRENEAARISASRSVGDDVLREIAKNREFVRHYQIKLNLVSNPRTPFTFASRLIPHLREADLRSLSRSKNIPGAVAQAVKQQLARKSPGRR
ncbi:MAG: hypothetical protein KC776_23135 [Myxococcales bacterium]|nr:hypothetical protein [Myxococcales bacterium]MCB9577245.1 hypothetical protein [Polyangiaceae bacterium]